MQPFRPIKPLQSIFITINTPKFIADVLDSNRQTAPQYHTPSLDKENKGVFDQPLTALSSLDIPFRAANETTKGSLQVKTIQKTNLPSLNSHSSKVNDGLSSAFDWLDFSKIATSNKSHLQRLTPQSLNLVGFSQMNR